MQHSNSPQLISLVGDSLEGSGSPLEAAGFLKHPTCPSEETAARKRVRGALSRPLPAPSSPGPPGGNHTRTVGPRLERTPPASHAAPSREQPPPRARRPLAASTGLPRLPAPRTRNPVRPATLTLRPPRPRRAAIHPRRASLTAVRNRAARSGSKSRTSQSQRRSYSRRRTCQGQRGRAQNGVSMRITSARRPKGAILTKGTPLQG